MRRWENVTSQLEIKLTDEMRDELGLFDDAERLKLRVKHSGYDDPPTKDFAIHAIECDVLNCESDEIPLAAEQINIILDGGATFSKIEKIVKERIPSWP